MNLQWAAYPAMDKKPAFTEAVITELVRDGIKDEVGKRKIVFTVRRYPKNYIYAGVWTIDAYDTCVTIVTKFLSVPHEEFNLENDVKQLVKLVNRWLNVTHVKIEHYTPVYDEDLDDLVPDFD